LETISKPLELIPQPLGNGTNPLGTLPEAPLKTVSKPLETVKSQFGSLAKPITGVIPSLFKRRRQLSPVPTDLFAQPLTAAAGAATSAISKEIGKILVAVLKPLLTAVVGGVFYAFGGGIGALLGSWRLNSLQNFCVRL